MNVAKTLQITKLDCDICKKEISSKYKFKSTKSVHEGLKKYKCDNCGKQFTQNVDLKSHIFFMWVLFFHRGKITFQSFIFLLQIFNYTIEYFIFMF